MITDKELEVIKNKDFIIIKSNAIEKIYQLFAKTKEELKINIINQKIRLPESVNVHESKISKGENYKGLPFLVLDYPKLFSQDSTFVFRTMFLWGNFFSCTLHIEGSILSEYRKNIANRIDSILLNSYYICVNDNPWEYHYEPDNYTKLEKSGIEEFKNLILKKSFIKLSKKIKLDFWYKIPDIASQTFSELMG